MNIRYDQLQWLLNQSHFTSVSWLWYRTWPLPNYERFPWSIWNGCVIQEEMLAILDTLSCPFLGLPYALFVDTVFDKTCHYFLDFFASTVQVLSRFCLKWLLVPGKYVCIIIVCEKGRDLTQSYDKSPYTNKKSKPQRDNTKTPPKTSITQRLRTDIGRSVGVTTTTQLVWLNRFTGSQTSC